MSLRLVVILRCNACGDEFIAPPVTETARSVRSAAAETGWKQFAGHDYCPDCEPEIANAPAVVVASLAARRRELGMTQAEVARRAGTVQSAVSDLESGRVSPTLATLCRYAGAVGLVLRFDEAAPSADGDTAG